MNGSYAAHYATLLLGIGLSDIETILSVVCLAVSIALGLFTIVMKAIQYMKDGKLDKEEIEDLTKDMEKLEDKLRK